MARYRGFVGQVPTLGGLGITRYQTNGYMDRLPYRGTISTNKITPTITTQATSTIPWRAADGSILPGWFETYCVPGSSVRKTLPGGGTTCPMYYRGVTESVMEAAMRELMEPVSPADQEIEKRQYAEGGDGTAELLETEAKIDEAIKRVSDEFVGERVPFDVPSFSMWHPDDVASSKPIYCMRSHPDIRLFMPAVCTPNQAAKDEMAAKGLKTTLPIDWTKAPTAPTAPEAAKPNLLPLAIGAGLIWLMM